MRFYRFDADKAKPIEQFDSRNVGVTPVMRREGWIQAGCLHFAPGSVLGSHPTPGPQLFLVVAGDGWVRTETDGRVPIRAGQAAFWSPGEEHESGSDTGMTVVVFEGPELERGLLMEEIEAVEEGNRE